MQALLSKYLGKLFLALALLWAGSVFLLFPVREPDLKDTDELKGYAARVQVRFEPVDVAPPGTLFPELDADKYRGPTRFVFVKELVKEKEYQPVELAIPTPVVPRSPRMLPLPGPSLQGSDKLPRWGDEWPPVKAPSPPEPKKKALN